MFWVIWGCWFPGWPHLDGITLNTEIEIRLSKFAPASIASTWGHRPPFANIAELPLMKAKDVKRDEQSRMAEAVTQSSPPKDRVKTWGVT